MGAVFGHAAKAAAREDIDAFEDAQLALQAMGSLGPRHFRVLDLVNESVLIQTEGGSDNLMIGRALWMEFFDNRDWPQASAVAVVLLALLLVPLAFYERAQLAEAERRS